MSTNLVTVANNRKLLSFEIMTFGVSINVSQEDERVPISGFVPENVMKRDLRKSQQNRISGDHVSHTEVPYAKVTC